MKFDIRTLARPADSDVSDLTTAVRTGPAQWVDGGLDVPFDRALTAAEVAAVTLRLTTADSAEETDRRACETYLDLSAPTTAQTTAQVKALTRLTLRLIGG